MPNWAMGDITIKGKPEDIEKFCNLFIFEDKSFDTKLNNPERYFARSFIHQTWEEFKEEELGEDEATFGVDFAWSAHSCLIEGYPQDSKGKCPTLAEACKEFNVSVWIDTEEEGLGFLEHIECGPNGMICEEEKDIPEYTCKKCGEKQRIPPSYDLGVATCYGCETEGEWRSLANKRRRQK